jgi:hypothetical protein
LSARILFILIALSSTMLATAQSNPFAAAPAFKAAAAPPTTGITSAPPAHLLPPLPSLPPPPPINLPTLHVLAIYGDGATKSAVLGIAANPAQQQAAGGTQIASTLLGRHGQSVRIDRSSYVVEIIGDGVRLSDPSGEVVWQGRIEFPVVQAQGANPTMAAGTQGSASMTVGTPMPSPSAKIVGSTASVTGGGSGGQGAQTGGMMGGQTPFGTTR